MRTRAWSGFILVSVGVLLSAGATGCGSSAAALCDDVCECIGCSDDERQECIDNAEDTQKIAEDEGCADQVDDVYSCYADQLECRDSKIDLDGCETEEKAAGKCLGSAGGGGISTGGGPGDSCGRIKACCVALLESIEGGDPGSCDVYDEADNDACQAAIDLYEVPEGADNPPECEF